MLTTVVGNYPKVAEGLYSTIGPIAKWERQELTDAQLEEAFREVTRQVIREQEQAGVDLVTDGQIRWDDLVRPLARGVTGFEVNGLSRWFNNNIYYRRPILHKAPARRKPILVEDYRFAAGAATRPVKAVLPGPYTFAVLSEDRHFKRLRPFALALAELLNAEARDLERAGAAFIQFDEPAIGCGKTDVKLAVEALNVALGGLKGTTAVVAYFGALDGALAALMKSKADVVGVDVVSDPKNLAALRRAKVTKALALGCVDARNTKLESVTELHARFKAVRNLVPADRLYVSPNCGLEFLPHTQAQAKLTRLVEAVRTYRTGGR